MNIYIYTSAISFAILVIEMLVFLILIVESRLAVILLNQSVNQCNGAGEWHLSLPNQQANEVDHIFLKCR